MDDTSGTPAPDPSLDAWVAEVRSDMAARDRARLGALRAHAAEDATLVGVLADLRERAATVVLHTTHGRNHRGEVLLVGPDALVLKVGARDWLVTRLAAVASVRLVGGDPVTGEGAASSTSRFGRMLAAAAQPGEWLRMAVGGDVFGGAVMTISAEVAVLRLDGGDIAYVNLDAVEEAVLLASA